ncbi:MAG: hypothetical protein HUU35_18425, partial [Armatimonadetes bacterium]|nr:hypothetical protein [Armatimonadota bacterium]
MRLAMLGASLLCLGAVSAAEPLVIDDFESGVGRWQRVEGTRPAGLSSLLNIAAAAEAKVEICPPMPGCSLLALTTIAIAFQRM